MISTSIFITILKMSIYTSLKKPDYSITYLNGKDFFHLYMLTQTLEQMDGKSEQNCMKPETHTHKTALLFIFCQGEILQPYDLSGSSLMTFLFKAPPWQVTSAEACASSAWTPLRVWSPPG